MSICICRIYVFPCYIITAFWATMTQNAWKTKIFAFPLLVKQRWVQSEVGNACFFFYFILCMFHLHIHEQNSCYDSWFCSRGWKGGIQHTECIHFEWESGSIWWPGREDIWGFIWELPHYIIKDLSRQPIKKCITNLGGKSNLHCSWPFSQSHCKEISILKWKFLAWIFAGK